MQHPDSVNIYILGPEDRAVLDNVAVDVFDGPVNPVWTYQFLASTNHHLAVAVEAGMVVGMASAVHYVHPDKAPELWINEVGVSPAHRGKGVAKKLLAALFDSGVRLGCQEAWVLTEVDNLPARRLYASSGGQEQEVRPAYFTFRL